jgi:hypothetical protein
MTGVSRHTYRGACHCGNIEVSLQSGKTPSELGVRTDTCAFCNKHHALYTSDPSGQIAVRVHDAGLLERYRFGTRTADFLVCRRCGVLVAACMADPPLAVVNVNALEARAAFLAGAVQVADLDGESLDARLARRCAKWTPVSSFDGAGGDVR